MKEQDKMSRKNLTVLKVSLRVHLLFSLKPRLTKPMFSLEKNQHAMYCITSVNKDTMSLIGHYLTSFKLLTYGCQRKFELSPPAVLLDCEYR